MKILFWLDNPTPWNSGIWYHRVKVPTDALTLRGHSVKHYCIGVDRPAEDVLKWPDVVIFGRTYPNEFKPIEDMKAFKKAGVRVLWDVDDDFWAVRKSNPSVLVSSSLKDQYEGQIRECDAVITPSRVLAKKMQKLEKKKAVYICPNGINYEDYHERKRVNRSGDLFIGYMAASSHFDDMKVPVQAIEKLSEKHDFYFYLYGMTSEAWEAASYNVRKLLALNLKPERTQEFQSMVEIYDILKRTKMIHKPFMPPEIHPMMLSECDFDIGIAPLAPNEFNEGKSCIKFYEYAATGTATLASDHLPYSDEVNYRAKWTVKDWYDKLERLIVDVPFREKLQKEQSEWVNKNRSIEAIGLIWEKALQLPGGLKVHNQS